MWDSELTKPPGRHDALLCYKLMAGDSQVEPFVLKLTNSLAGYRAQPGCGTIDIKHPLLMRQRLVVGIDVSEMPPETLNSLKLFNLNITPQAGTPINPTPMRATFSSPSSSALSLSANVVYFLPWPEQVPGDVVPTVTVSVVYSPPVPGAAWAAKTLYVAGSVVTPNAQPQHFFTAQTSGISGATEPTFLPFAQQMVVEATNSISWREELKPAPGDSAAQPWQPNTLYQAGATVTPTPVNCHLYKAANRGVSGVILPTFSTIPSSITAESTHLQWLDAGLTMPSVTGGSQATLWLPSTPYFVGNVVLVPASGHYYIAMQSGLSGSAPVFPAAQRPPYVTEMPPTRHFRTARTRRSDGSLRARQGRPTGTRINTNSSVRPFESRAP